jgi:photosystem II stability/assembly factor-like uncharacterized protein
MSTKQITMRRRVPVRRLLLLTCILAVAVGFPAITAFGQPWTQQTSGTAWHLWSLKVVDSKVVWASGGAGTVLRTVDGGTTWQVRTATDLIYDNYSIEALDSITAWVYGSWFGAGAKIWKTANGGTSWTEQYSDAQGFGDGIRFFDANNGIALGDPLPSNPSRFVILTTTNGGTTWSPIANSPPADSVQGEASVPNALDLNGSTAWFLTYSPNTLLATRPRVFKSTDKGLTWAGSPRIGLRNSSGFSMGDENRGIMSRATPGGISRTFDGWATADSTRPLSGSGLTAVDWIPGTNSLVIVGSAFSGVSLDGGVTWAVRNVPAGVGTLNAVHFIDPGTGFAVGYNGTILKWTDPPLVVAVRDDPGSTPGSFLLSQNYPNPFNPSTTIRFELPKASNVRLSVFDMLGREVSVLMNERRDAGVHEVKFDGPNLASGVYFYRLTADNFVQSRKLLLMK